MTRPGLQANEELAALRAEIDRLKQSHSESVARLWAKVENERRRSASATAAAAQAHEALERRAQEAAAHTEEAAAHTEAFQALRAKLNAERLRASVRDEQLGREIARSRALDETATALRLEIEELSAQLAEAVSDHTRAVASQALQELGPSGALDGDQAARRIVDSLRSRRGAANDAAEYFRLGRMLQLQGASELAAAAYRKVGPRIAEFLAQPGPDGSPISGPEFLIIGAARASTTWLKRVLSHHPAIFMLAGEPQFFSMTSALGPDAYVSRFAGADARFLRRDRKERSPIRPEARFHGEKSTTYLTMPDAQIALCAALYPKARIICLVRNPINRAWSHVKHDGLGHLGDRPHRLYDQPYWSSLDGVIRHGRYAEHLARWARRYPPEQIHLIDFARVASDPDGVYREALEHIGVEPLEPVPVTERVNPSEASEIPSRLARILEAAYADDRWDLPWLRQVMERAAGGMEMPGRRRARSPVASGRATKGPADAAGAVS